MVATGMVVVEYLEVLEEVGVDILIQHLVDLELLEKEIPVVLDTVQQVHLELVVAAAVLVGLDQMVFQMSVHVHQVDLELPTQ